MTAPWRRGVVRLPSDEATDVEVVLVVDGREIELTPAQRSQVFKRHPELEHHARKGRGMWGASRLLVIDPEIVREALELFPDAAGP
ncbi:MAG TPA: hypothetical protein VH760_00910 [Gaiellaceae bacterium]